MAWCFVCKFAQRFGSNMIVCQACFVEQDLLWAGMQRMKPGSQGLSGPGLRVCPEEEGAKAGIPKAPTRALRPGGEGVVLKWKHP